ncbi:hypothetical protein ACFVW2_33595 [Streptomyces sp. NPDC058171]
MWTLPHAHVLRSLASDSYRDFLRRSQEAERMAEQWYRPCSPEAAPK